MEHDRRDTLADEVRSATGMMPDFRMAVPTLPLKVG